MTAYLFLILLVVSGMWCLTDGWFSLSLYLKNKDQTWYKDHYIRVIRMAIGCLLIWMALVFGSKMIGE